MARMVFQEWREDQSTFNTGGVAQVVEQRTHKPLAGGSNPSTATTFFLPYPFFCLHLSQRFILNPR
jgi:hypothetical protein